jgi:hypothetical protein
VKHLQAAGFSVETENIDKYDDLAKHDKVPASVLSCHTAKVGQYTVEGHVPAAVIERLLREKPKDVAGIGVAGMPAGSPGMESRTPIAYKVMAWRPSGETFVYATVAADGTTSRERE